MVTAVVGKQLVKIGSLRPVTIYEGTIADTATTFGLHVAITAADYELAGSLKEDIKRDYETPANNEVGRSDECRERPTATATVTLEAVCEK